MNNLEIFYDFHAQQMKEAQQAQQMQQEQQVQQGKFHLKFRSNHKDVF